jgi:hypothetical protein
MSNMLKDLPKLTELDLRHIGCWLNGPEGRTPTPTREEIALLGREKLRQAAQRYFETWFTSYGKSPSSSSTSCTYDKLFG